MHGGISPMYHLIYLAPVGGGGSGGGGGGSIASHGG